MNLYANPIVVAVSHTPDIFNMEWCVEWSHNENVLFLVGLQAVNRSFSMQCSCANVKFRRYTPDMV